MFVLIFALAFTLSENLHGRSLRVHSVQIEDPLGTVHVVLLWLQLSHIKAFVGSSTADSKIQSMFLLLHSRHVRECGNTTHLVLRRRQQVHGLVLVVLRCRRRGFVVITLRRAESKANPCASNGELTSDSYGESVSASNSSKECSICGAFRVEVPVAGL